MCATARLYRMHAKEGGTLQWRDLARRDGYRSTDLLYEIQYKIGHELTPSVEHTQCRIEPQHA